MQSTKTRRIVLMGLASALVVTMSLASGAQAVDVTGDWAFDVQTGMGGGTPAISFKQTGETLTGTYVGTVGTANFKGTIKGNAIAFAFEVEAQGQTIDVSYTGTVEGDTMKGAVNMAGGQLTGTFTGKKK
jgi:hypothetical protein